MPKKISSELKTLQSLRTATPANRADCQDVTYSNCTAFSCRHNITGDIAIKSPDLALQHFLFPPDELFEFLKSVGVAIRVNCVLDYTDLGTYETSDLAKILSTNTNKINGTLGKTLHRFQRYI
jgi:hypothetical protein